MTYDFLVVGSGCAGAQAARTLVEAGARVGLVDFGERDDHYAPLIPQKEFRELRLTEKDQYRYFLGDRWEGIPLGPIQAGTHLTPPREHVTRHTKRYLPVQSTTFFPVESLAVGGLGAAWGLGSYVYSDEELRQCGLDRATMSDAYEVIARRIGISANRADDIAPFVLGSMQTIQPPLPMDQNATTLLAAYRRRKTRLNRSGFYLGQCPLAMLSEGLDDRNKNELLDLDFWADFGRSAYRPWITIDDLMKRPNFSYLTGRLALRFSEDRDGVKLEVLSRPENVRSFLRSKRLLLCAGALGSARIAMRSLSGENLSLPVVCNPFIYIACLHLRMLGRSGSQKRYSMAQLLAYYDPQKTNRDAAIVTLFSYRSLLLFRLMKDFPFGLADGRAILQYMQGSLMLGILHHPDYPGGGKRLSMVPDADSPTGDALYATFSWSEQELSRVRELNRSLLRLMRVMGCPSLRRVEPPAGASIHYGGTLPFSDTETPCTTTPEGRLRGTRSVFVADSSSFKYLPAKGPTLSLMAYAHVTAKRALGDSE